MMNQSEEQFDQKIAPFGTRLDQRTKLSLMAAILLSTASDQNAKSVEEAVNFAIDLDRKVGDKLRALKNQRKRQREYQQAITPDPERKNNQ